MGKEIYIAEKPSVARQFAETLTNRRGIKFSNRDGYMESDRCLVTWCFGHLVTMSYPEVYDEAWKNWQMDPLPFIPDKFLYEVIDSAKKQFQIVKGLLTQNDVETIYVCTDSGREGEYIYRLVDQMAEVGNKTKKRVWIDSQTEDEIIRGIEEAKDLSAYDHLSDAAYLRAIEDYLMGINFSRALTLKYRYTLQECLASKAGANLLLSGGSIMTLLLGIVFLKKQEIAPEKAIMLSLLISMAVLLVVHGILIWNRLHFCEDLLRIFVLTMVSSVVLGLLAFIICHVMPDNPISVLLGTVLGSLSYVICIVMTHTFDPHEWHNVPGSAFPVSFAKYFKLY